MAITFLSFGVSHGHAVISFDETIGQDGNFEPVRTIAAAHTQILRRFASVINETKRAVQGIGPHGIFDLAGFTCCVVATTAHQLVQVGFISDRIISGGTLSQSKINLNVQFKEKCAV